MGGASSATGVLTRTDVVEVPAVQGQGTNPTQANTTTQTVTVRSQATLGLEYLASTTPALPMQFGAPAGFDQGAGIHVLPLYIDELERDLGTDMYLRMMFDSTVKSSDATLRDAILSKPLQVLPGCDEEEKDEARKVFAANVAAFVRVCFEKLQGGTQKVFREMLEAISMGYKLAEKVYEVKEIIPGNGPQTVLKSINPKPHEAVSIVVDKYNDVLGYLPRLQNVGLFGSFVMGDLGVLTSELYTPERTDQDLDLPQLVPPDKVWRFTWESRNDDPRGTSHFRAAYVAWRFKIGLWAAYEAYMARFAQPSTALELEGQDPPPMADANGQLLKDPATIVATLLNNLRNFQAGGAMVVPVGKLNMVQSSGAGQVYLSAFELCDQQIVQSILFSNLNTQGGKYGTQALGEVHQDTTDLLYAYARVVFAQNILEELVTPLVLYNYGEEGLEVLPYISFGETEQQDVPTLAQAISSMKGVGMVFAEQYNELFQMLHWPLLSDEVISELVEKERTERAADTTLAQNPLGAPPTPEQQQQETDQRNQNAAQDQAAQEAQSYW